MAVDVDKLRAQSALLELLDAVKAGIARADDALVQSAYIYCIAATDHALSHRSIDFELMPEESAKVFSLVKDILNVRLSSIEAQL